MSVSLWPPVLCLFLIYVICIKLYPSHVLVFYLEYACSRLSELALLYCQRIENDGLSEIGKGCKLLQALHLVDCSGIGDESICSIARGCKNLRKLHIRRCYEVFFIFLLLFKHIAHENICTLLCMNLHQYFFSGLTVSGVYFFSIYI